MDEIPTITIYTRGHHLEAMIIGMQDLPREQVDEELELYAKQHDAVVRHRSGYNDRCCRLYAGDRLGMKTAVTGIFLFSAARNWCSE
ncbi:MAG TPA: hypothetical protein PLE43_09190 [Alphaproteobacteria bacterium]|mgnify:CR=1 FL=1|nr:hypothetical protein [Alphaproteobacteria bacterium]